jgi:hypothetical protein
MRRLVLGLMTALSLTLVPGQAMSAMAGDPSYHRPTEGDCHDYTYAALFGASDTTPVVDCAAAHTAKVVKVFLLPDSVPWSNDSAVWHQVQKRCFPAYYDALGRSELTRALTSYSMAWFMPTKAEKNQGARWVRCDVMLWGGNKRLAALPYDAAPLIPNPITTAVRRCLTATFWDTTCTAAHAWKATGDFNVRKGSFPTKKQMASIAVKKCPRLVTSTKWRYDPPSKDNWKAGYRVMVCFSKTTS